MAYLPITKAEMTARGWDQADFIIVSGDAYIDHPSFGVAIISRILEHYGYKVAILPQPNWKDENEFKKLGKPRLGFLVASGNIDSMVNHYSVAKRRRKKDYYTPNGEMGKRPDRATIIYSQIIRKIYGEIPIVIGGVEASLRRFAHYDYWDNKVRRSILLDSHADLLIYGMAEQTIVEVAEALDSGMSIRDLIYIRGTVWKTKDIELVHESVVLPEYDDLINNKEDYAKSFMVQYTNADAFNAKTLVEPYKRWNVVQNPPSYPQTQEELDVIYSLPYERYYHPSYNKIGHIPAINEVQFSIISNRGCFGGCNFCALTFHQGRIMQTRSHESIIKEATKITKHPEFKGYIHDVGGPTANFQVKSCGKQDTKGVCATKQCLWPDPCKQLNVDHSSYVKLLRELRNIDKVKKVFVRSGLRYDYMIYDNDDTFFNELVQHHISGQLKVAPEHVSDKVLEKMGKPTRNVYDKFVKKYKQTNQKYNKDQYLVPYLMSSHPGSTLKEAIELAEYLRDLGYMPEQVQDFYPTPGTMSTCMYYTELDPRTMKPVYVPKTQHEKAMQRALIQYRKPQNYELVQEALIKGGREDLIGYEKRCLIRPRKDSRYSNVSNNNKSDQSKKINNKKNQSNNRKGKQIKKSRHR